MQTTETFTINDIEIGIIPSDIQVLDDNYVIEESYMRSNACFVYRSKYANSKVVLNIPFEITSTTVDGKTNLSSISGDYNNTDNCIKLIAQLNDYPFCFIKSNRLETYVGPTAKSQDGYMIFAVDELAIVTRAEASNILFLEVVLMYFNHLPLVKDFKFRQNLKVALASDGDGNEIIGQVDKSVPPDYASNLSDSTVYQKYFDQVIKDTRARIAAYTNTPEATDKSNILHNGLRVSIAAPYVNVVSNNLAEASIFFANEDMKTITVTDIANYDNGTLEKELSDLSAQDFTASKTSNTKNLDANEEVIAEGASTSAPAGIAGTNNGINEGLPSRKKQLHIQWSSHALDQQPGIVIHQVEVRKKNRLAMHQIGSYKHPVIQHMGRYPTSCSIQVTANNEGVFEDNNVGGSAFLKHIFNILDYNNMLYPEAASYNFLKIKNIATALLKTEAFLPSQNQVIASAATNGTEGIVYTFNEGDLTEFVEMGLVKASGKKSTAVVDAVNHDTVIAFLASFKATLDNNTKTNAKPDNKFIENLNTQKKIYANILTFAPSIANELTNAINTKPYLSGLALGTSTQENISADGASKKIFYLTPANVNGLPIYFQASDLIKIYFNHNGTGSYSNQTAATLPDPEDIGFYNSITNGEDQKRRLAELAAKYITKTTNELHSSLISALIKSLTVRKKLLLGEDPGVTGANVSFKRNISIDTSLDAISKELIKNAASGEPIAKEVVGKLGDSLEKASLLRASSFFGQCLNDYHLESLVDKYNVITDTIVQNLDPFFFIDEISKIDGDEIINTYDYVNKGDGSEGGLQQNLLDHANGETNVDIDPANSAKTKSDISLEVTPLTEQMYSTDAATGALQEDAKLKQQGFVNPLGPAGAVPKNIDGGLEIIKGGYLVNNDPEKVKKAMDYFIAKRYTPAAAAGIVANLFIESGLSPKPYPYSGPGSTGVAQWTKDRITKYRAYMPGGDLDRASLEDQYGYVAFELQGGYLAARTAAQNAPTAFDAGGIFSRKYEAPGSGKTKAERESSRAREANKRGALAQSFYNQYVTGVKNITESGKPKQGGAVAAPAIAFDALPAETSAIAFDALPAETSAIATPAPVVAPAIDLTKIKVVAEDKVSKNSGNPRKGIVLSVIDSNTIVFRENGTTKNTNVYNSSIKESPNGTTAQQAMTTLVKGKPVTFVDQGLDSSGRHIGKILLPDGTDPSLTLLRNGVVDLADGVNTKRYLTARNEAKSNKIGIWNDPKKITTTPDKTDVTFDSQAYTTATTASKNVINSWLPVDDQGARISEEFSAAPLASRGGRPHHGLDIAVAAGSNVRSAADGVVSFCGTKTGYGNVIEINHYSGFTTLYAHLSRFMVARGQPVKYNDIIGLSGGVPGTPGAGRSSGAHLHYAVRYSSKGFVNPRRTKKLTEYTANTTIDTTGWFDKSSILSSTVTGDTQLGITDIPGITEEQSVYNEANLARALADVANACINVGLKTAVPTIRAWITIGTGDLDLFRGVIGSKTQYYELRGIKNFHLNCNNDTNPVDVLSMEIANPSFIHTDAYGSLSIRQSVNIDQIGTDNETNFINDRIKLRPGMKLHVRMGYDNNPNDLDIVFNGSIVECSNTGLQNLSVICEGFGKELLSEILAPGDAEALGGTGGNASTGRVIHDALHSEAIFHFGKLYSKTSALFNKSLGDNTDPEAKNFYGDSSVHLISKNSSYFLSDIKHNLRSKLYTNIYSPEIEEIDGKFSNRLSNLFSWNSTYQFRFWVWRMTPWEVVKQMEYRHPSTIVKPMWYEDRMTMFYGIKEQFFISKDAVSDNRVDRFKPAVGFHAISSYSNLISNGIALNGNYSTVTNVSYFDDGILTTGGSFQEKWTWPNMPMQIDDNLMPWERREKDLQLSGCYTKYSAFVYGTTDLQKECEQMYTGKILVLGNANMKAGDYAYIDDHERRLQGIIKIRECYHHFDEENGFTTEIVPGQYVEPANFLHSMLWAKMGLSIKAVTSKLRDDAVSNYTNADFQNVIEYLYTIDQFKKGIKDLSALEDDATNVSYITPIVVATLAGTLLAGTARFWEVGGVGKSHLLFSSQARFLKSFSMNFFGDFMNVFRASNAKSYGAAVRKIGGVTGFVGSLAAEGIINLKDKSKTKVMTSQTVLKVLTKLGIGEKAKELKAAAQAAKLADEGVVGFTFRMLGTPFRWLGKGLLWLVGGTGTILFKLSRLFAVNTLRLGLTAAISGVRAILVGSGIGILLDVFFEIALMWAFAKIEESQLTRQPLLFFPLIQHGKPYVAGMSGVIRNDYLDSLLLEGSKTWEQVVRTATIFVGNRNLDPNTNAKNSTITKIASNFARDIPVVGKGGIVGTPITDANGKAIKLDPTTGKVIPDPPKNGGK